MKIQDEETAVPFDDIIIALFDKRNDKEFLNEMHTFVIKNKYDYSLIHLYTLSATIIGYLEKLKTY